MIDVRMPTREGERLVQALRIAAGAMPAPTDPADRRAHLALGDEVKGGLDAATRPARPAGEPTGLT
ncbi:hypothetical protein [Actinomadura sp. SCN-SB]|uniref:hypothetical protein n=1 Tax=Actinomadura sp. SCN-SB TaxID=3373092 RepID=UPI0037529A2D